MRSMTVAFIFEIIFEVIATLVLEFILEIVIGGLIAAISDWVARRLPGAVLKRRQEAAEAGWAFAVPVKLRLLDRWGWGRRWREGMMHIKDGRLRFRPRRPRIARRFDLSRTSVLRRRPAAAKELFWFGGREVLVASHPELGNLEMETANEPYAELARLLLATWKDRVPGSASGR